MEIIFESSDGIIIEKPVYPKKGRCQVAVKRKNRRNSLIKYNYKNAPGLQSPYLNWENLSCCGGWGCDETYLNTAVQRGLKLFAGIKFFSFDEDYYSYPS